MIGKRNQASSQPLVQDIMSQASVYGATIPIVIGTVLQPPLLIWLNGIRKTGSGKKGGKKHGSATYACQLDMLLGHNPILTTFRCFTQAAGWLVNFNKINVGSVTSYTITDPQFYCVLGATVSLSYSEVFNDYGATGSDSVSGTYELPLWNAAIQGPDPTNPSAYRWAPYSFYCLPGSNVLSQMHFSGSVNIYYASLPPTGWGANTTPLAQVLNCAFESSLGDGNEYASPTDFTAQRIVYPMYAGVGSSSFDLGTGSMPQVKIETYGNLGLYPDGIETAALGLNQNPPTTGYWPAVDADYIDMVELILKRGMDQAALLSTGVGTATGSTPSQTGCSSFDYPGTIQKKFWSPDLGSFGGSIQFDLPVAKGNTLVVAVAAASGTLGVSDTLVNTWTTVLSSGGKGFWYAKTSAAGTDTITLTGVPSGADVMIFELAGCDTVDAAPVTTASGSSVPSGTVTSTQAVGQQGYVLTWVFPDTSGTTGSGSYPPWKACIPSTGQGGNFYGAGTHNSFAVQRIIRGPATVVFTGDAATSSWTVVMLALKNAVAPSAPKALGSLVDDVSFNLTRAQDRANGLWGSLLMNSQKKASEWLADIFDCANAAPVWSGFKLKSIPRSEVSAAGFGAVYNAPTASGPVATLGPGDMIGDSSKPLITVDRTGITDRKNLMRLQFPERNNDYRAGTVSQPDPGGLVISGLRYDTPRKLDMVPHANIAKMLLGIFVRRESQLVRKFKFTLKANYKLLEAMDLVLINEPLIGIFNLPVRLTAITENEKYELQCEAEDFIYGLHDPKPLPVTTINTPNKPGTQTVPAAVNAPIFLEPPGAMTGSAQDQLWIAVSDADPVYGGAAVYVSVDGGVSYEPLEDIDGSPLVIGNATTGVTTANWPQALDPDTTNDLPLDLTESLGTLEQFSVTQEDQFLFPCYVAGGGGVYPFELMTYAVANLTGTNLYTLKATGGNKLRRAVFGTWASSSLQNTGALHNSGARFAALFGDGIFKVNVPSSWVGKTLNFKFVPFNTFGGGQGTLATATAYPYTVLGTNNTSGGGTGGSGGGGNVSYTINPTNPLSQTSTTNINMVNVTATFSPSGLQTFYVTRNFTIPAPSSPTTYYVTVFDPNFTGDTGNTATLTAFCTTTQAGSHVGQPGYIYMGNIVATTSGTSGGGSGGGTNPSGQIVIQIPIPSTTHGDFSIAHGLGKIPSDVDIKNQSDGVIRFQSGTMWDATNVYLNASDDGLTGTLVIEL